MGRLNGKSLWAWCYKDAKSRKPDVQKELQFREKDRLLFFQSNFQKYSWFSSRIHWIFQTLNSGGLYMRGPQDLEVLQPRAFFSYRFISKRGLWRACWKRLFLKVCSQQRFWPLRNLSMLQICCEDTWISAAICRSRGFYWGLWEQELRWITAAF